MKTKKLIKKAQQLIHIGNNEHYDQVVALKRVLKELKKKKNSLKEKLEHESDKKKIQDIKGKLEVISSQRKKGLNLIKKLNDLMLTVD